jgi:hypothetical protein
MNHARIILFFFNFQDDLLQINDFHKQVESQTKAHQMSTWFNFQLMCRRRCVMTTFFFRCLRSFAYQGYPMCAMQCYLVVKQGEEDKVMEGGANLLTIWSMMNSSPTSTPLFDQRWGMTVEGWYVFPAS